jgi:hypothetical protein
MMSKLSLEKIVRSIDTAEIAEDNNTQLWKCSAKLQVPGITGPRQLSSTEFWRLPGYVYKGYPGVFRASIVEAILCDCSGVVQMEAVDD